MATVQCQSAIQLETSPTLMSVTSVVFVVIKIQILIDDRRNVWPTQPYYKPKHLLALKFEEFVIAVKDYPVVHNDDAKE